MNPDFYETGIAILKKTGHENCPFCDQSVEHPPASDQIARYLTYFADAEGQHKKELRKSWGAIKSLVNSISAQRLRLAKETNKFDNLKKLVPSQRDTELPNVSLTLDNIDVILSDYFSKIEEKGKTPSATVEIPAGNISDLYASLGRQLQEVNARFKALRAAVSASDAERKALHRNACRAFQSEFARSNWTLIEAAHDLEKQVKDAETEIAQLKKSQISDSVKERVATTFKALLSTFFGEKYSFDSSAFVLKRDNREMTRGPSRTLSDGEKTTIAFCYFIACIHKKIAATSDYKSIFLVFDDPITSMSYDFIFAIAQTLKNLSISINGEISINPSSIDNGNKRPDLIVFTHSSYFYNICVTNRVIKEESAFFLHRSGSTHKLSKLAKYIAPFEQHLREIFDVQNGSDPSHTTGNAIRCVLEAVGRFCHPDKCESLSKYITYLAGEEGFEIKSVLINNLSHGTYYDDTPSPDEIREACGEAIKIVEKYAKGQLQVVRALYGNGQS